MPAITFGPILLPALALVALAMPAAAQGVTAERLLNAAEEPQNWLMNHGNYAGHRYSALDQINRETVGNLVVRFSINLGGLLDSGGNYAEALPASPLVDDGFMYIADGWGAVNKLDLRQRARLVWRSEAGQGNLDAWLQATRGLAFHGNSVLAITADGQLEWIDRASGEITRTVQVADPREGYTISAPPLVVGDTIMVGGSGVDRGARSRIDAIDATDGAPLWTLFPGPAEVGGGAFLQTGVYDPQSGFAYWGASHAYPRYGRAVGDEVFGNVALAVDVADGRIAGEFAFPLPRPFSEAGTYPLVPDGDAGVRVTHFGNDGTFYAFAPDLTLATAAPYLAPAAQGWHPDNSAPQSSGPIVPWADRAGCPNIRANPSFVSTYSPRTGLVYGAGADACHAGMLPLMTPTTYSWLGAWYTAADAKTGLLTAVEPVYGEVKAQRLFNFPLHAGALSTAGHLIFTTTADGTLHALDDETLEPVWSHREASLTSVPPITFMVDGEQFLAVVVGGNAWATGLSYVPEETPMSQDLFVVLVFGQRTSPR